MRKNFYLCILLGPIFSWAQERSLRPLTPFETSGGKETSTYAQCIAFYQQLDQLSSKLSIKKMGISDAGYPYHLLLYSNDGETDPQRWHRKHKVVLLINNGIHPGEPDGVDASMILLRDLVCKKIALPDNVALAIIPLYNIGGALNRGSYSRVNQDGPSSYGFRGNAQNLDLNRDFTKNDTRDARSFARIFHWINPDILIDNHVSDGADYQYTMTLLSSQWNKLGGLLGQFLHDIFQPALFTAMEKKGWPMTPYVNFEEGNPEKGWDAFYDPPRYSSGYAALFNTMAFMPETHMLKPFHDRVLATYALMEVMITQASTFATDIITKREDNLAADLKKNTWPLHWKADTSRYDTILFRGFRASTRISDVSGLPRLYYDHQQPFEKEVRYYDYFAPDVLANAPLAYVIPQGWHEVLGLLALNGVQMIRLPKDTLMMVSTYHIDGYQSSSRAYEKHHRNTDLRSSETRDSIQFLRGDYWIPANQPSRRFLVEMLEPAGEDSYFSWNFFDAILQQKEGYSPYRWEDLAASWLKKHPEVKQALEDKKHGDSSFAQNGEAQLDFVYKHSVYYEPAHLRYPVYRVK